MKKIITLITLIFLLASCSKTPLTTVTPNPTTPKIYAPLFKKGVQWEFISGKRTKPTDTSFNNPVGVNIVLGSRVIFFEDFRVNTRRNGLNTGPNACNSFDARLSIGGVYGKDSSFVEIKNRYNNVNGSCDIIPFQLKILNFTDSTITLFHFINTNDVLPEEAEMYYMKIYK